jgi:hypothetical protein
MPPSQSEPQPEPPMPFGRFVPVYEPDVPRTASAAPMSLPPVDYALPPRTARREPHPADMIDPQARELIRQRELAVARQRQARIQYRKWHGISLLRPYAADPTRHGAH